MRKLFGTDGIRGRADAFPLDDATMVALGQVLVRRLRTTREPSPSILLGIDGRESGPRIARALAGGIADGGGRAELIGIIPTPGVAWLCRTSDAAAGISISASHNPWQDNGVKVFGEDGMKLADEMELEIEGELEQAREEGASAGKVELRDSPALIERYEAFLLGNAKGEELGGMRLVVDAGNGAAHRIAPDVFRRAGAEVVVMNADPDGRNINEASGALHPEAMARRVVEERAHFGVAFDGDADRAIFADDRGSIRDGDEILYLWGSKLRREGALAGDTIVSTVMSNLGFERKLREEGVRLVRAQVGDKYVLEAMLREGAVLGGEQSGHIIDLRIHTTGDGIHTAVELARLLAASRTPFSGMPTFVPMPQILLNERVASRPPLDSLPRYRAEADAAAAELGDRGRILVRYSGTENLVRVMVEGEEAERVGRIAERLVSVLRDEIGGRAG
ncbi:MAG TPA: phosphoglucosamine mutase [Thermoanaerobaculia bacterium]|nr:phosphoglucosamine mutase [Thermoanaerobaculia bacterium]